MLIVVFVKKMYYLSNTVIFGFANVSNSKLLSVHSRSWTPSKVGQISIFYCAMEVQRNRTYTIKQSDYLLEILTADLAKRYMLSTTLLSVTLEERKCDMAAARSHSGSYDGFICACAKLY